jgi:hypothetical protein
MSLILQTVFDKVFDVFTSPHYSVLWRSDVHHFLCEFHVLRAHE